MKGTAQRVKGLKATKWMPLALGVSLLVAGGCHQDMWSQPKAKPQSKSDAVFDDKSNSRLPVMGTVAYGKARADREFFTGYDRNGRLLKEFPVAVTEEFVKRGQERFRIFCTPCHGELGNGKGFIAKRGFTASRPVGNYHSERLRNMPIGHFYDVITNGFGVMYPFRGRIKPYDRWAIAAYIRVLQASQHVPVDSIPPEEKQKLMSLPEDPSQNAAPELPVNQPVERVLGPGEQPGEPAPRGTRTVPLGVRDPKFPPDGMSEILKSDKSEAQPTGAGSTKQGGNDR